MTTQTSSLSNWGPTLLRAALGVVFLAHGSQKLFIFGIGGVAGLFGQIGIPFPTFSAVVVTAVEILGGLALLLGLFTRRVAPLLAILMLVAGLTVHFKAGFFLPEGFEYIFVLMLAAISLTLSGSGAASLDKILEKRHA